MLLVAGRGAATWRIRLIIIVAAERQLLTRKLHRPISSFVELVIM